MFNTLKYYKLWFVISGVILLFGIISLAVFHLKLGIDFKGGTEIEIQFSQAPNISAVQDAVRSQNLGNFQTQSAENNNIIIKTVTLDQAQHDALLAEIKKQAGNFTETHYDSIGPVVGKELSQSA